MTPLPCYIVGLALVMSCALARLIDLSHKHGPKTYMSNPRSPRYNLTNLYKGTETYGVYVEQNYYGTSEHGGTHIDAPSHFVEGGMTLDDVPLEHTVLDGVMINCKREASMSAGYVVPKQKLLDWEKVHGEIPPNAAVLFSFGWYTKFENEDLYRGASHQSNPNVYLYPTVSEDAARWLLDKRDMRVIGTDTLSPDIIRLDGVGTPLPIHVMLLSRNRLIVENLRNLDRLPARDFRFHTAPVKFVGASGAQVRAYAVTHDQDIAASGNDFVHLSAILAPCVVLLRQLLL